MNHSPEKSLTKFATAASLVMALLFIASCNTPDVANHQKIQKRKYRQGYYVKNRGSLRNVLHAAMAEKKEGRSPGRNVGEAKPSKPETPIMASSGEKLNPELFQKKTAKVLLNEPSGERKTPVNRKVSCDRAPHRNVSREPVPTGSPVEPDPEANDNSMIFGWFGFGLSLVGLAIPAAAPLAVFFCRIALTTKLWGPFSVAGIILGLLEILCWSALALLCFLTGAIVWAWIIAALLLIGGVLAIILRSNL